MNIPIPETIARMQFTGSIYSGGSMVRTNIDDPMTPTDTSNMVELGSFKGFSVTIQRSLGDWAHLRVKDAGLPIEVYPAKRPSYTFGLDKIMLYNNPSNPATPDSIMAIFGMNQYNSGFDIIDQYKPLIIGMNLHSPTDINGDPVSGYVPTINIQLLGAWFESLPLSFDVENDMLTPQSVTGRFARMRVSVA